MCGKLPCSRTARWAFSFFPGPQNRRLAGGSPPMDKIADLVSLASIVPPPNHEVSGGFNAIVDGKQVRVRAVLERTVVIEHQEGGERSVVRKDNCLVKPSAVACFPAEPHNRGWPRHSVRRPRP